MRTTWNFHTARQLTFGWGAVEQLSFLARRNGWQHVLVVTDSKLRAAALVERVERPLVTGGVAVSIFDGGEPEPTIEAALRAIETARRCRPDAILGLGGGSNMDLAKVTACVYSHGGAPNDYFGWD